MGKSLLQREFGSFQILAIVEAISRRSGGIAKQKHKLHAPDRDLLGTRGRTRMLHIYKKAEGKTDDVRTVRTIEAGPFRNQELPECPTASVIDLGLCYRCQAVNLGGRSMAALQHGTY